MSKLNEFIDSDQSKEAYDVESSRDCARLFQGKCSLVFYETDGTLVRPEQTRLELDQSKPKINLTHIIKNKVK